MAPDTIRIESYTNRRITDCLVLFLFHSFQMMTNDFQTSQFESHLFYLKNHLNVKIGSVHTVILYTYQISNCSQPVRIQQRKKFIRIRYQNHCNDCINKYKCTEYFENIWCGLGVVKISIYVLPEKGDTEHMISQSMKKMMLVSSLSEISLRFSSLRLIG